MLEEENQPIKRNSGKEFEMVNLSSREKRREVVKEEEEEDHLFRDFVDFAAVLFSNYLYNTTFEKCVNADNDESICQVWFIQKLPELSFITLIYFFVNFLVITQMMARGLKWVYPGVICIVGCQVLRDPSNFFSIKGVGNFRNIIAAWATVVFCTFYVVFWLARVVLGARKGLIFRYSIIIGLSLYYLVALVTPVGDVESFIDDGVKENPNLCKFFNRGPDFYNVFKLPLKSFKYFVPDLVEEDELMGESNSGYLSFPNLRDLDTNYLMYVDDLQRTVYSNIEEYKSYEEALDSGRDVVVGKGKVDIYVNKLKMGLEKLKDLYKESSNIAKIPKNVIVVKLSAVSRRQFMRDFQKTKEFLKEKNSRVYDFKRFHSLNEDQEYHQVLFRYGKDKKYPRKIGNIFKKKGFLTSYITDKCQYDERYLDINSKGQQFALDYEPYHHNFLTLFCHKSYFNLKSRFFNQPHSPNPGEIYGRKASDYSFEYAKKIIDSYAQDGVSHFMEIELSEGDEMTLQRAGDLDESLRNFLGFLTYKEIYKQSLVVIWSGMGNSKNMFFQGTMQGMNEKFNPLLVLSASDEIQEKYGKLLGKNKNRLMTVTDLNKSLLGLVREDPEAEKIQIDRVYDFFKEEVFEGRSCLDSGIRERVCRCF